MNKGIDKQSIEEFIINEGVFADIALDEGPYQQDGYFLEDESDQEGHVDIFGCDEEDVHEVYEVYKQEELMARHHCASELVPHVFEEDGKF